MRNEMNLTINDGTSKSQLIKAIRTFENMLSVDVLQCWVGESHTLTLVYFNGVTVNKRYFDDVNDFINFTIDHSIELSNISTLDIF